MRLVRPERHSQEDQPEDLITEARQIEQEARMVIPGVQALFGFQLVAVFNATFSERLSGGEQRLHLMAIALTALSVALILAPAAYHRQREPGHVSRRFVDLATRFLSWGMLPLMMGVCLDFYLISRVILGAGLASGFAALSLLGVYAYLWFLFPRMR